MISRITTREMFNQKRMKSATASKTPSGRNRLEACSPGLRRASDALWLLVLCLGAFFTAQAAPVTLGPLQSPNSFDRSSFSFTINYNINLSAQTYNVHLPANYSPIETYGLITYIDAADTGAMPSVYQSVLDEHRLIFLAGTNIGNSVATSTRQGVAIMGSFRMTELHQIDPARIFIMGNSGGARTGVNLVYSRPDWFSGFIGLSGAGIGGMIPNWAPPGRLDDASTTNDYWPNDPEIYEASDMVYYSQTAYRALPQNIRIAVQAFNADFRRTELVGTYRYGYMNHGCATRLVYRNGGHSSSNASAFDECVRFMLHPHQRILHDRFEDGSLATNTDPANPLKSGSGFLDRSTSGASAAEVSYPYNSKPQKVLRLTPGNGTAAVEAATYFDWRNPEGIILDAKFRAETQAGDNQQIGLHIVRGDGDNTPHDNPGLHVFRNHGGKNRLVLVKADGSQSELAAWDYSGTHPMAMPASDKLFWDSAVAPQYAARTRDFRGEDLRIQADSKGMQLTFSRPAANFETSYANGVILGATARTVTNSASSYFNQSDNEDHPIIVQCLWADMGLQSAIDALNPTHWKLLLSNRAINPAASAGDALFDEVTLVAPAAIVPPAQPPTITSPLTSPVTLVDAAHALVLTAFVPDGTGPAPVLQWSKSRGPGAITFSAPNEAETTATFSAPGRYEIEFSVTRGAQSLSDTLEVIFAPPADITFREGVNGYTHTATFIRNDGTNNVNATWNSGTRTEILIGHNNSGPFRTLFSFDLTSLPAAFPVTAARLDLWTAASAGAGTVGDLTLHPLNSTPTEGTGDGSSLSNGSSTGATWIRRTNATANINWLSPGGDFSTEVLATIPGYAASSGFNELKTFTSSPAFVATVEAARQSGSPLNLLARSSNTSGTVFTRLHSDDSAIVERRPLLTLSFTENPLPNVSPGPAPEAIVGEPAALVGFASGADSLQWSLVAGPGSVEFATPTQASTTVTFGAPGIYQLRLSASNGNGTAIANLTITASQSLTAIESWRQTHFGTIANTGNAADSFDANFDGETNLLEFATGQNPHATTRAVTTLATAGADFIFTYTRSMAALDDDYLFTVEYSDTLDDPWVSAGSGARVTESEGLETMAAVIPAGTSTRRFARLRITPP